MRCTTSSRGAGTVALALTTAILGVGFNPLPADVFVYSLNLKGKLSVNGTVLDALKTGFDDDPQANPEQRYGELLISGSDRYALRRDGEVYKNGKKIFSLPYNAVDNAEWLTLALLGSNVYSLREDGLLTLNSSLSALLPTELDGFKFPFSRVITTGTDLYSLRVDGAIFKNGSATPLFQLQAGAGVNGFVDGRSLETVWIRIAVSPADGDLYALRADGVVFKGNLPPANATEAKGALVNKLPFPSTAPAAPGKRYVDFGFTADGKWFALRANGEIYNELSVLTPLVDLPGDATSSESSYQDMAFLGSDYWSIRGDGRIYKNASLEAEFDAIQALYARVAIGTDPPSLTSFKNSLPVVSTYNVVALEGASLSIPFLLTDTDKLAEDVTVTPVAVPPGSSFDEETRTLVWENAGPVGKYRCLIRVFDGVKKPKVYKFPIKIIPMDLDPAKNKPPILAKIKKVQAIVDVELRLPILTTDPDGDELTITPVTAVYPFTAGASFDSETSTFRWTPAISDVGKTKVRFRVSDGIKVKVLTVPISVMSPLIF